MTLLRKYPGILKFMILFLLIFLIVIFVFRNSLYPVFFSLAEARAVNKGGYIVNQIIAREIENIEYEDLITYEKNNDGKIALMQPNIREINRFSSKLSMNIKNNLNEMHDLKVEIPLLRVLGFDMLAGFGPNIEVKILPAGFIRPPTIVDSFESAGINQIRHKIYLNTNIEFKLIVPFSSKKTSINSQIPIIEVTILGDVPDIYVGIDGEGFSQSGIIGNEHLESGIELDE